MRLVKTCNVKSVAPSDLSQALSRNKSCSGVCRKKVKTVEMDIMVPSDGLQRRLKLSFKVAMRH
jgi:hypothetical protein